MTGLSEVIKFLTHEFARNVCYPLVFVILVTHFRTVVFVMPKCLDYLLGMALVKRAEIVTGACIYL